MLWNWWYYALIVVVILIVLFLVLFLFFWYYYDCNAFSNVMSMNLNYLDERQLLREDSKRDYPVYVSLTTIPGRINKMKNTLKSLLLQTEKPTKILLNIPYKSLKEEEYVIPDWMSELKSIEINRISEDMGPSSKLLPTIQYIKKDSNYDPKTAIIFLDDDVIYSSRVFETLLNEYEKKGMKDAISMMGRKHIDSYSTAIMRKIWSSDYIDVLTGVDSALIGIDMLPENVFDYSVAPRAALFVDDDWISGWLRKNGIKIWSVGVRYQNGIYPNPETWTSPALSKSENKYNPNVDIVTKWFQEF